MTPWLMVALVADEPIPFFSLRDTYFMFTTAWTAVGWVFADKSASARKL